MSGRQRDLITIFRGPALLLPSLSLALSPSVSLSLSDEPPPTLLLSPSPSPSPTKPLLSLSLRLCRPPACRCFSPSPSPAAYLLVASLPTTGDILSRFLFPKNYVRVRRHKKRHWLQHADVVSSLAVGNCLLYSISWDKSLKVWRESDLRCLEFVTAHEDAVNTVTVAADGTVDTGSADSRIRVCAKALREKNHSLVATLQKHKSAVNALALNDDG